jgi:hypothetical protein
MYASDVKLSNTCSNYILSKLHYYIFWKPSCAILTLSLWGVSLRTMSPLAVSELFKWPEWVYEQEDHVETQNKFAIEHLALASGDCYCVCGNDICMTDSLQSLMINSHSDSGSLPDLNLKPFTMRLLNAQKVLHSTSPYRRFPVPHIWQEF